MRYLICLLPVILLAGRLHAQKQNYQSLIPALEARDMKVLRTELCKIHDINAPDAEGKTALFYCAMQGNVDAIRMAISEGADVNKPGKYYTDDAGEAHGTLQTPLHAAAQYGHLACVELLLSKKATVDAADENNETPLHLAARFLHKDVAVALLKAGAKVDLPNKFGHRPLNLSIENNDTLILPLLIAAGSDLNMGAANNAVPLAQAILTGNATAIRMLLEAGANVNIRHDSWGNTPLHLAAGRGMTDIVRLLLDNSADKALTDNLKRLTPQALAEQTLAKLESDKKAKKETIQVYKDTIKLLKKYKPKKP